MTVGCPEAGNWDDKGGHAINVLINFRDLTSKKQYHHGLRLIRNLPNIHRYLSIYKMLKFLNLSTKVLTCSLVMASTVSNISLE